MYNVAYALKNEEFLLSSSGGAFPSIVNCISEHIIDKNNNLIVYGAAFDKDFLVKHIRIDDLSDLWKLYGSKYVRSDYSTVYKMVEEDLLLNRFVVFSGTPCQIYSLIHRLDLHKIQRHNLFTIDIICHGTVNEKIWIDFKNWLETKYKSKIVEFSFRYNKCKWRSYPCMAKFQNGKKVVNTFKLRRYTEIFYSDLALNSSCYNCRFTNCDRVSDLTIGDFWGIRSVIPDFPFHENVSEVFVNSKKGYVVIEQLLQMKNIHMMPFRTELAIKYQQALNYRVVKPDRTIQFWNDYSKKSFQYILHKYFGYNIVGFVKHSLKKTLGELGIINLVKDLLKI